MLKRKIVLIPMTLVVALAAASGASAHSGLAPARVAAAPEDAEAVVLPSRVANAIRRTSNSLENAENHLDEEEYTKAIVSLRSVRRNLAQLHKAAKKQMNAAPPAEEGAEGAVTPADSVIAAFNVDQAVIVALAGMFNGNSGALIDALGSTMTAAQAARDNLLTAVLALDPEGAGADYADGMADTVDGYTDEVANLTEAISDDKLSTGGLALLRKALTRSNATLARINAAYGGGE